ncbi:MAG: Transglutaminase-like superfamily protein [Verrucomicrobiales bacterium]|nr:Transglutaminase-like superfamily protein [Verrucomicrobiales bacterium]
MKLHITHKTQFTYQEPVTDSFNEARLQPTSADGQICHSYILKVLPTTRLSHFLDFYLNYVHFFEVPEPHSTLVVESTSIVTTQPRIHPEDELPAPLKRVQECVQMEQCYDFLQPSSYVSIGPEVWSLSVDACNQSTDVWQASLAIMRFIHQNFQYTPQATSVSTHMAEVLQQRRGVCQDFTHVMLGMCRSMKIPARYVSGYLYNDHSGMLLGSQASHAWCEVFVPGSGWRALDPTNNRQIDENFVKVAVGRDYSDIVPVKGRYKGSTNTEMAVDVNVTRIVC